MEENKDFNESDLNDATKYERKVAVKIEANHRTELANVIIQIKKVQEASTIIDMLKDLSDKEYNDMVELLGKYEKMISKMLEGANYNQKP